MDVWCVTVPPTVSISEGAFAVGKDKTREGARLLSKLSPDTEMLIYVGCRYYSRKKNLGSSRTLWMEPELRIERFRREAALRISHTASQLIDDLPS